MHSPNFKYMSCIHCGKDVLIPALSRLKVCKECKLKQIKGHKFKTAIRTHKR